MKKIIENQRGMTLVEIMVVVTIIGIIATLVTVNVVGYLDRARVDTTVTTIRSLEQMLEQYRLDNGSYPSSEQGLNPLAEAPSFGKSPKRYPAGGYIKGGKVPKDSWKNELVYSSPGANGNPYEIVSIGPDQQEGSEDDIKSWEIE